MTDERLLSQILKEHLDLKGLTIERLVSTSGIPDRYVKALYEGDYRSLPAAPYVHAYLKRLAALLDLQNELLINAYNAEAAPPRSGLRDLLPTNRFAQAAPLARVSKKTIVLGIIILTLILYLAWGASRLFGIPSLTVTSPENNIDVHTPTIILKGTVSRGDLLTINNNEISVNPDGSFEKEYPLDPGLNTIDFRAKRFLGRTVIVTRSVQYIPSATPNVE